MRGQRRAMRAMVAAGFASCIWSWDWAKHRGEQIFKMKKDMLAPDHWNHMPGSFDIMHQSTEQISRSSWIYFLSKTCHVKVSSDFNCKHQDIDPSSLRVSVALKDMGVQGGHSLIWRKSLNLLLCAKLKWSINIPICTMWLCSVFEKTIAIVKGIVMEQLKDVFNFPFFSIFFTIKLWIDRWRMPSSLELSFFLREGKLSYHDWGSVASRWCC